jgi:ATP-dependent RNA helicase RhlE
MKRVEVEAEALHGGIEQKDRFSILERFREGKNNILVTTDVACRGIDIPDMDYVINYDLPDVSENYVHRCGRTGRGNHKGHAISFCAENERILLDEIETYTGAEIERFDLQPEDYKDIVDESDFNEKDWKKLLDENSDTDSWSE